MLTKFLENKKGAATIFLVLILAILLASIIAITLDMTHITRLAGDLDIVLDSSAKAASIQIDENALLYGNVFIDKEFALSVFKDMFERNFLSRGETGQFLTEQSVSYPTSFTVEAEYFYVSPSTGNRIDLFVKIINTSTPEILTLRRYPFIVSDISADRPTIAVLGVLTYNRVGLLQRDPIIVKRVAVSQLTAELVN